MKNQFTAKFYILALLLSCIVSEGFATVWTTGTAGPITTLGNWTNGTSSPTSFTTPGDTWIITMAMTMGTTGATATWVAGTASSTLDTVVFATGGALNISGASGVATVTLYGNVFFAGGTFGLGGAGTSAIVNVYGNDSMATGTLTSNGASSNMIFDLHGNLSLTGGTINSAASATIINLTVTGNSKISSGTVSSSGAGSKIKMNLNGSTVISGGTISSTGASDSLFLNTYGDLSMTAGTDNAGGAGGHNFLNGYGNCSFSGTSAFTNTGAGSTNDIYFALNTAAGPMLIDNTSTGAWSGTNAYVDANCTAQLDGNFSTTMGGASYGLTVNGTLICPAAYMINGGDLFDLTSTGTLEVAIATGVNGAILTTGTKTFNPGANYVFNGTVAQVTGSYLPAALVSPDTITISNAAGVTLSQTTATTGTLLFTSGILNTGAFTMSVPGAATGVIGAGATSYVNGTLIKTIFALTSVNFEVGDLDYAPMLLTLSTSGTSGSLGLKTTTGLHPSVASSGLSTANMANHYWTITNYGAAGPATVIPKATYNLPDIIGGTNTAFKTQEYSGSAWLGAALATTNTSAPYTSTPTTGIALASLAGAYIFGNVFCGTLPISVTSGSFCAGTTSTLSDPTGSGTWTSGDIAVASVGATGIVTGVAAGTDVISYTVSGCTVTTTITVNPLANPGHITGQDTVCTGQTVDLSDTTGSGGWTSSNSLIATIGTTGIVAGVAGGTVKISYTVSNDCGAVSDTFHMVVLAATTNYCKKYLGTNQVTAQTTTELKLFPNPNTGSFAISLLSEYDEEVQVVITNIVGEKVREFTTTTNKETDVSLQHTTGMYLLSASTVHGRYVSKVVIQ